MYLGQAREASPVDPERISYKGAEPLLDFFEADLPGAVGGLEDALGCVGSRERGFKGACPFV